MRVLVMCLERCVCHTNTPPRVDVCVHVSECACIQACVCVCERERGTRTWTSDISVVAVYRAVVGATCCVLSVFPRFFVGIYRQCGFQIDLNCICELLMS